MIVRHFIFGLLIVFILAEHHDHDTEINDEENEALNDPVTYGSIIKLEHQSSGYILHSHEVTYGSGSGQQSVTVYPEYGDTNSLWQILNGIENKEKKKKIGSTFETSSPVECNDIIRLKHLNTNRWLHSHRDHRAPISHKQEVTGYGQGLQQSDRGDDWRVICGSKSKHWIRKDAVAFQHLETGFHLFASKKYNFNDNNCRNCPILGQLEVSAVSSVKKGCKWKASHGVYFRPLDKKNTGAKNTASSNAQHTQKTEL